jgi:UDP-3-O-[3-hydroxymyristoyl] N-acetylglucosamine deacetylase
MNRNRTFQKTIRQAVDISGIGLHSGRPASIRLLPASVSSGIQFIRKDLPQSQPLQASFKLVHSTQLATNLGRGQNAVSTVEHLLAALQLLDIDNLTIEVSGPELPILDGSAGQFVAKILTAGIQEQNKAKQFLMVRRKIEFRFNEKWARIEPSSRLEVHGSIEFDHPIVGYQEFSYIAGETPIENIAYARTFGFLKEVELMHKAGLARGGSLENAVVIDDSKVLNPEGLRYPNEFARHKVLDALGDFKLAGINLCGHFRLHRAGHDLHTKLLEELLRDSSNYEIIGDGSLAEAHYAHLKESVSSAATRTAANY